jgi:hypothetical protein
MPINLANGSYRVQIRVGGFPRIDRCFASLKAAEAFEASEREKIGVGPTPLTPQLSFSDAVDLYQRSSASRAKKPNTQKTERSRVHRAVEALGDYSLANLADGQRLMLFLDSPHDSKLRVLEKRPKGSTGVNHGARRRNGDPDGTLRNESIRLEIAAASTVMDWAVWMRILVVNPIKIIARPSDLPRCRRLHRDKVGRHFAGGVDGRQPHLGQAVVEMRQYHLARVVRRSTLQCSDRDVAQPAWSLQRCLQDLWPGPPFTQSCEGHQHALSGWGYVPIQDMQQSIDRRPAERDQGNTAPWTGALMP